MWKITKKKASNKNIVKKEFSIVFTNWVWSKSSLMVHTTFFVVCFISVLFWVKLEEMLLILTTVVSLEAIYLAIFIQMTVNRNTLSLKAVEEDIDEIQEDIDEIQEDVDEIQEDVDEITEDNEEEELETDKAIKYIEKIEIQMQNIVKELEELKNYKK
ncbi:MAG: hypothetical protein ACD_49C00042G0004 [uncultured bacterium (gcode 4)]|uniref:DUF1003 domain-containing protein n=1 Tax=uncultured bacterium (gcode 4) TaxID=1234023 RepID=K2AXE7_9BACT|nr:MAG: hypothetical protein ACD_49C00042G0004 [uncultured bacterium (gcode 4)]